MIDNYEYDQHGIIRQISCTPIEYDRTYVDVRYNTYGILNDYMSHLRLGYITGSMGRLPHSVLDIGYGNGSFLSTCSTVVPECRGYDISTYPVPENCTQVDDIYADHHDVVTFFDSLEHYQDIDFLNKLQCNYVCISLPWCHYFSDEWFLNWKHRRPDEHLWHFNHQSLVKFMNTQGFDCVNVCNVEDIIRKHSFSYQNILTAMFKRISN
jgi:hypothetical protein